MDWMIEARAASEKACIATHFQQPLAQHPFAPNDSDSDSRVGLPPEEGRSTASEDFAHTNKTSPSSSDLASQSQSQLSSAYGSPDPDLYAPSSRLHPNTAHSHLNQYGANPSNANQHPLQHSSPTSEYVSLTGGPQPSTPNGRKLAYAGPPSPQKPDKERRGLGFFGRKRSTNPLDKNMSGGTQDERGPRPAYLARLSTSSSPDIPPPRPARRSWNATGRCTGRQRSS
ncbi:hypothetical protein C8F04DRAFT_1356946 [Mycena alexandri]|uniref:Uncharacterized protein n=1 Tax=Mycena alexandri TaxID=1745969 RepID=A0AAD6RY39_9AGAR|nr:hypothetical protein C8F04DRAFT_1279079 [Mycena alexandri]KAJ7044464.1 hypothetical protein C8F04DRAFT_1356946 [Mycena alexandri]